jgi:putative membrane protein
MAIMMVMFFAVVAAVLYALLRPRNQAGDAATSRGAAGADDALRLLDERFAQGDIEAEDYTKRRDLLRSR